MYVLRRHIATKHGKWAAHKPSGTIITHQSILSARILYKYKASVRGHRLETTLRTALTAGKTLTLLEYIPLRLTLGLKQALFWLLLNAVGGRHSAKQVLTVGDFASATRLGHYVNCVEAKRGRRPCSGIPWSSSFFNIIRRFACSQESSIRFRYFARSCQLGFKTSQLCSGLLFGHLAYRSVCNKQFRHTPRSHCSQYSHHRTTSVESSPIYVIGIRSSDIA